MIDCKKRKKQPVPAALVLLVGVAIGLVIISGVV
jgi:hypothetical protein